MELFKKALFFFIEEVIEDTETFTDEEVLEIRDFFAKLSAEFDIEVQDGDAK